MFSWEICLTRETLMSRCLNPTLVTKIKFDKSLCEDCGRPLFLTKEECRDFIERKMKKGYIVCSCCGKKQTVEKVDTAET